MIEVFEQENIDGIAEKVKACSVIYYSSVAQHDINREIPDTIKAHIKVTAGHTPIADLYPIKSILATTGINLNDDWLGCEEAFAARNTVADKPFNYNHTTSDIIGHMTESFLLDENNKEIDTTSPLPNKFHIANSAVLYKYWDDSEEKQKRMDEIITEISSDENKWCVSMECRFTSFDYVLIPVENGIAVASKVKVVSRNPETAHLTKHLRAYGGTGKYNGYKIGRALKNITYAGVGLVRNPANPESVILKSPEIGIASEKINNIPQQLVYENDEDRIMGDEMSKTNEVPVELKYTEAQYKELETKLETLSKELETVKASNTELTKVKDELKVKAEEFKAKADEVVPLKEKLSVLEEKVAKAKHEERLLKVKEAYAFESEEDAIKSNELFKDLSDEAFASHLELVKKNKPKQVEQKVDATILDKTEKVVETPTPIVTEEKETTQAALARELSEWWTNDKPNNGKKEE